MKVLMIGWEYPPQVSGGLGTACYWLNKALIKEGVDLEFIASHPQNEKGHIALRYEPHLRRKKVAISTSINPSFAQEENIVIGEESLFSPYSDFEEPSTEQEIPVKEKPAIVKSKPDQITEKAVDIYTKKIIKAAGHEPVDIVHGHDWPTFRPAQLIKEKYGIPMILHVHSTELDRMKKFANSSIFAIEKEGFEAADKIIAVSQFTKSMLVNFYEIAPEKIEIIYNGVPEGFDHHIPTKGLPELNGKVVTYCGRITQQKGPKYFINAAYKVLEKEKDVYFIMAGDGNLRNEMIELAAELGISRRIFFPGYLDVEEVKDLFSMTDLLVMPSVSEPFGLVAVEAISSGVPVIVSKESGVSEILKDICTIDYWETEELAKKMINFLKHPMKAKQLVESCQQSLAPHTWEHVARQVIDIYDQEKIVAT